MSSAMVRRRSVKSLGQRNRSKGCNDFMFDGFSDELKARKSLLELFGTGYARVLLVHLKHTVSVSWNIEQQVQSNDDFRAKTEIWSERLADAIPSQGPARRDREHRLCWE